MHLDSLTSKPPAAADIQEEDGSQGGIRLSKARKICLLITFCCAQFVDVYNASAVVLAIPEIAAALAMETTESVWTLSAYVLTFASFMLPMGKLADLYSARFVFIGGLLWVGAFSLGVAVTKDKVILFVLRAFAGLGAAASIPAALNLIVHVFPNELEQNMALASFGGAGELANVSGFIIGGVLLLAGWRWVFWLLPMVCFPLAILGFLMVPKGSELRIIQREGLLRDGSKQSLAILKAVETSQRSKRFDFVGTFLIVAAAVLSIFGLTDGGESGGWARAQPIVCLALGILLYPCFFLWERRMDQRVALIPSSIWRIQNVTVLIIVSLLPYFWWYALQYNFANIMQELWGVTPIMTAVRFLPISIGGGIVFILVGFLPPKTFPLKWRMVVGALVGTGGTIMLVFAKDESYYWKLVAPGMFIGSLGIALVFISANNSVLMSVPTEYSGVVGGVFNSTLQLGAVIGLAINATIQAEFPLEGGGAGHGHAISWEGYRNSFILMACLCAAVAIMSAIWFKDPAVIEEEEEAREESVAL